jgi:hypothetical protein
MSRHLTVIATREPCAAERAMTHMNAARDAANEHMEMILRAMETLMQDATAVQGPQYPVGWPDEMRRLANELDARGKRLLAMMGER